MDTDRLRSSFARTAKTSGRTVDAVRESQAREVPADRLGTAEEFGQVCAFLCSAQAGYITGQNILVDGGLFPGAF